MNVEKGNSEEIKEKFLLYNIMKYMNNINKQFFFYKNTPEYKKIVYYKDWSLVIIYYLIAIRIALFGNDNYDFFINVFISIAIGYLISYFYFYLITLRGVFYNECRSATFILSIIVSFINLSNAIKNEKNVDSIKVCFEGIHDILSDSITMIYCYHSMYILFSDIKTFCYDVSRLKDGEQKDFIHYYNDMIDKIYLALSSVSDTSELQKWLQVHSQFSRLKKID